MTKLLLAITLLAAGLLSPLTASAVCNGASSIQQVGCSNIPPPKCPSGT